MSGTYIPSPISCICMYIYEMSITLNDIELSASHYKDYNPLYYIIIMSTGEFLSSSMESDLIKEKGADGDDFSSNQYWWRNQVIVESLQSSASSQGAAQAQQKKARVVTKRSKVVRLDRSIRNSGMERRVRMLKRLVPNCNESVGVEGLFRETADYIVALQMRIKVMQTMVSVLSGSADEDADDQ